MQRRELYHRLRAMPLFGAAAQPQPAPVAVATCPNCNCVLDRPHALRCTRCLARIPNASGCKNCGRCRKG